MEKIIHCCWFGKKEMPLDQQNYIKHWKELMPDYEIRLWKDEDFEPYLGDSAFVKECLKENKPGFLSDFFRFTVLYEFGGIYMDTDVEMMKSFEPFTHHKMFLGYIFDCSIGTATIGAEKGNPVIKAMKEQLLSDFEKNRKLVVSNDWVTKFFISNYSDFHLNGKRQNLKDDILILPKDYLERYCLDPKKGGGYAEHHCYGSWYDRKENKAKELLKKILGRRLVSYLGHRKAMKACPYYSIYKQEKHK